MDKKFALVSVVALIVLALMVTTVIAADPAPVQNSIASYLKLMNANIVEGKNVSAATNGSSGVPAGAEIVIQGTKEKVSVTVEDSPNGKLYFAQFKKGYDEDSDYLCVKIADSEGKVPTLNEPHGMYCLKYLDNIVVVDEIAVSRVYNNVSDALDCYTGASVYWRPFSDETKKCDLKSSAKFLDISNVITLYSYSGRLDLADGGKGIKFKITPAGGSTYPKSS